MTDHHERRTDPRRPYPYARREGRGRQPWVCGTDPSILTIRMSGALHDLIIAHAKRLGLPVATAARAILEKAVNSDTPKSQEP